MAAAPAAERPEATVEGVEEEATAAGATAEGWEVSLVEGHMVEKAALDHSNWCNTPCCHNVRCERHPHKVGRRRL